MLNLCILSVSVSIYYCFLLFFLNILYGLLFLKKIITYKKMEKEKAEGREEEEERNKGRKEEE